MSDLRGHRFSRIVTVRKGVVADPEGFEPSRAGLEIRSPIRARRRVRSRARNANANNPSTRGFGNRYVAPLHLRSRGVPTSFGPSYLGQARSVLWRPPPLPNVPNTTGPWCGVR